MKALYRKASLLSSRAVTNCYSTSFSIGIKVLDKSIHDAVYAVYGFVRLADEIVDTFHDQDKKSLLQAFKVETHAAIKRKLSLNPVLNSFQWVVNDYNIEDELIDGFLKSMELDLTQDHYNEEGIKQYIYGSAEVVGLMCLRIFLKGDEKRYQQLKPSAQYLGSAFQKINFLRDLKDDFKNKGRTYFPNVDLNHFTEEDKKAIEADLQLDFDRGFEGIKQLPENAKLGVYTAYTYYLKLFQKIQKLPAKRLMEQRIRITDAMKYWLLITAFVKNKTGQI
jgi:phytoene/squalene synthetase